MALKAGEFEKYGREYIKQAFKRLYNRDPNEEEIQRAFPSLGRDPNVHDITGLNAYLSGQKQIIDTGTKQAEEQKSLADSQAKLLEGLFSKQAQESDAFRESQRKRGLSEIEGISNIRKTRRDELSKLLSQQVNQDFSNAVPQLAEDANTAGLLHSTGFGEALARERAKLAAQSDLQLAQTGLSDLDSEAALRESLASSGLDLGQQNELTKLANERNVLQTQLGGAQSALSTSQGAENSALSRGFSLQDFSNQAQLAKELGASAAPSGGGGKGQAGTLLSGIGAIATPLVAATNPALGAGLAAGNVVAQTAFGPVQRKQTIQGGGGKR